MKHMIYILGRAGIMLLNIKSFWCATSNILHRKRLLLKCFLVFWNISSGQPCFHVPVRGFLVWIMALSLNSAGYIICRWTDCSLYHEFAATFSFIFLYLLFPHLIKEVRYWVVLGELLGRGKMLGSNEAPIRRLQSKISLGCIYKHKSGIGFCSFWNF